MSWTITALGRETRAVFEPAPQPTSGAVLVIAHGAGSDMEHRSTVDLAAALRAQGIHTVRFNFFYRSAGKRPPDPMPRLVECYRAVVQTVRRELAPPLLLLGGRSLGGRTASMLIAEEGGEALCDGLVLFAYPLHPPGKPDKLRDAHLGDIGVPALLLSGTRDTFCTPELMRDVHERLSSARPDAWTLHWLEGADHGYHVLKRSGRTDADVLGETGDAVRAWIETVC
jgi:hypothetical protein